MKVAKRILTWYGDNQRDLPWRHTRNPYFIWVSEIMLQQTRVDTAIPYYHRFLSRFPTVESLARAPLQDVLKAWENLGYYSRARHLHAAAKQVTHRMGGEMPETEEELLALPGIGSYTAAAILSIAFGQRVAAVDGNVRRVICRIFAIEERVDRADVRKWIHETATALVPRHDVSRFNQAIMDFGATLCTPQSPACERCPLPDLCLAYKKGCQSDLPVRNHRKPIPHVEVTAGIIPDNQGRVLVVRRPVDGFLGGLWKFPGGEKRNGDTRQNSLREGIKTELGIDVEVSKMLTSTRHAYSHFRITLFAWTCVLRKGKPEALACSDWQWIDPVHLSDLPFSRAERKIMTNLGDHFACPASL